MAIVGLWSDETGKPQELASRFKLKSCVFWGCLGALAISDVLCNLKGR